MINLHESMGPEPGSSSRPLDLQSDAYLLPNTLGTTALRGLVSSHLFNCVNMVSVTLASRYVTSASRYQIDPRCTSEL